MEKNMEILILEDDDKICAEFEKIINSKENINLLAKTNSSFEALELAKKLKFDGIIVDLELHYGKGSGLNFLKELEKMQMSPKPIVIVNTNIVSDIIYDNLHKGVADIIFYKKQKEYNPEHVIDTLLLLRKDNIQNDTIKIEQNIENNVNIENLINYELDLIGISYKLKGRQYIFESIYVMLDENIKKDVNFSVFQYISGKHKLLTSSISKAIQTAINETWRTTCIEDLKANYTAKINYHTGVPTPTEFIYYYKDKISKKIKNN